MFLSAPLAKAVLIHKYWSKWSGTAPIQLTRARSFWGAAGRVYFGHKYQNTLNFTSKMKFYFSGAVRWNRLIMTTGWIELIRQWLN